MAKGDHILVSYGLYTHHGIDLGDGTVVEWSKGQEYSKGQPIIARVSFEEFSKGQAVTVVEYSHCDPPEIVVGRALSRIGETGYDLVFNNCEHFATWCKTGRAESVQVKLYGSRAVAVFLDTCTISVLTLGVRTAAKAGSRCTGKLACRGATPWLLVADGLQFATEHVLLQAGASEKEAKTAGCFVGAGSAVAIGCMAGGPLGGLIGFGVWLLGETIGSTVAQVLGLGSGVVPAAARD